MGSFVSLGVHKLTASFHDVRGAAMRPKSFERTEASNESCQGHSQDRIDRTRACVGAHDTCCLLLTNHERLKYVNSVSSFSHVLIKFLTLAVPAGAV